MTKRTTLLLVIATLLIAPEGFSQSRTPRKRKARIVFTKDPRDAKLCKSTTVPQSITVRADTEITFKLDNDTSDGEKCDNTINNTEVKLDFMGSSVVTTPAASGNDKYVVSVKPNTTQQKVKFKVTLSGKMTEDPEIDIDPNCPCPPPIN